MLVKSILYGFDGRKKISISSQHGNFTLSSQQFMGYWQGVKNICNN